MKNSLILLLSTAIAALAQNLGTEPECAVPCLTSAIQTSGCAANDQGCQCSVEGRAKIQAAATSCLVGACSPAQLVDVLNIGNALCSSYSAALISTSTSVVPATTSTSVVVSTTEVGSTTGRSTSTVAALTTNLPAPTTSANSTGGTNSTISRPGTTGPSSSIGGGGGGPGASSTSSPNAAATAVVGYAAALGGLAALLL